jgi:predicted NAD-dependent protein-ADP-ribosyltransferase YbiA (DUF1768 family)
MKEILAAKFEQHPFLTDLLLRTKDRQLMFTGQVCAVLVILCAETSAYHVLCGIQTPFWGTGTDQMGQNELGRALMRLRAELRDSGNIDFIDLD